MFVMIYWTVVRNILGLLWRGMLLKISTMMISIVRIRLMIKNDNHRPFCINKDNKNEEREDDPSTSNPTLV